MALAVAAAAAGAALGVWADWTFPNPVYGAQLDVGWAKTYDAEYVALAQILDIPVLTREGRDDSRPDWRRCHFR